MKGWHMAAIACALTGAAAAQTSTDLTQSQFSAAEKSGYSQFALLGLSTLPHDAPQPAADPRNLEGTWYHDQVLDLRITRDMHGIALPYTSVGQKILDRRLKANYVDKTPYANPGDECLPPGQPWQLDLNFPFQIYQSKNTVTFVFQEFHGIWNIRMNQPHRVTGPREYMGDSVGHWEGDTLVVDTVRYKERMWLDFDGTPASADAHLISRIRKVHNDFWELEIVTTVDDPQTYSAPWSMLRTYSWRPNMTDLIEYNCESQVGGEGGVARFGLSPEPKDP